LADCDRSFNLCRVPANRFAVFDQLGFCGSDMVGRSDHVAHVRVFGDETHA
jgi:hypothetical protein